MDELTYYYDRMRHLICLPYSVPNLHRMADDLGIKRCWYHGGDKPHYDIPKKDIERIKGLATELDPRDILKHIKNEF